MFQQRRNAGGRYRTGRGGGRFQAPTQGIGVGGFVQGAHRASDGAAARIDQVDAAEVPAGIAQMDLSEVTIAGGDLEALAVETDGAVRATLPALDFDAKGGAQVITAGALAPDVGPGQIALQGRGVAPSSRWTVR